MAYLFRLQANAVWRWYRSLLKAVPPGKRVLRINMDETSVAAFHGHEAGNITPWRQRGLDAEPITWADRKKRRTAFTHAAFICDDSSIQPLLPQLILANEKVLSKADLDRILQDCPHNCYVKRQKSGWMNIEVLKILLGCLLEVLTPYKDSHQIILFLDAHKSHIARPIAEFCARKGIFLIIIPARLTFLLQPADTHLFARYKRTLKRRYHELANASDDGTVHTVLLFRCIFATIRTVMQGLSWRGAFAADGYDEDMGSVSSYIMRHLSYTAVPEILDTPPDRATLAHCFPRNCSIPEVYLLRPFRRPAQQAALLAPPPVPALAPPPGNAARVLARGVRLVPRRRQPTHPAVQEGTGASSSSQPWPTVQPALSDRWSQSQTAMQQEGNHLQAAAGDPSGSHPGSAGRRVLPWTLRSQS